MTIKTPWELAKPGCTEHAEQCALFCWANFAAMFGFAYANDPLSYNAPKQMLAPGYGVPALKRLHAIHNQGHGNAIRGAKAAAEGVKAGVPDIFLPVPKWLYIASDKSQNRVAYCGLYIEMKRKNGKHSDISTTQLDWLAYLNNVGYRATVAFGWEEAAKIIQEYLT